MASTTSGPTSRLPAVEGASLTTWLPLTTVYPVVPECTGALFTPSTLNDTIYAYDPNHAWYETPCWPEVATSWWNQKGSAITSLGPFLCPGGYSIAGTSIVATSSTLTACCPSGYTYIGLETHGNPAECGSSITQGQTVTYVSAVSGQTSTSLYTTLTTIAPKGGYNVTGVQVNGYNFDGNSAVASITGSVPTLSSGSGSTATSTSGSQPSAAASTNSGLSTGAKIGLGVGIPLGLIAIAAVAGALLLNRRRKRTQNIHSPAQQPFISEEFPQDKHSAAPPYSAPNAAPVEMNNTGPVEMSDTSYAAEMDGTSHVR